MTCSCLNSRTAGAASTGGVRAAALGAALFLLAALNPALPADAAQGSFLKEVGELTLGAQPPQEEVPEPDFEEDEEADSTALIPTTPTPVRGTLPGDSTGIAAGRDSTARADSSAQADSARVRAGLQPDSAAGADSAAVRSRALSARADSIRAHRATARGAVIAPKRERTGILGLHPAAILAGLIVLHVLVVRWIAD